MFRSCKVGSYNVYKIYKRKKYIFCFPANGWPNSNVNVQGPFNMILWLRKILFITRNIWGNKCMTYFKGPCTKFEVELMSFFIHFGCICIETQIMERFLINNDDPNSTRRISKQPSPSRPVPHKSFMWKD